eukprot:scaffold14703_cov175-Ochromonas_danica.AAC.6
MAEYICKYKLALANHGGGLHQDVYHVESRSLTEAYEVEGSPASAQGIQASPILPYPHYNT